MSWRKALWALGLLSAMLSAVPRALWAQGGYLDETLVRVKPDKANEFEAIARKIADANRRNAGDNWVALETIYGSGYTYAFVSRRENYAEIDKGNAAFMGALNKALGKQGSNKLMSDLNDCILSMRSEFRVLRPDLSSKLPSDPEAFNKMVGESRVLRTIAVHIRPGHSQDFEALVKEVNQHAEQNAQSSPMAVSMLVEGGRGTVYYLTTFRASLAGFDNNPSHMDILGQESYEKFEKTIADTASDADIAIYRFAPELSNPPAEIAEASPDFWNPKPMVPSSKPHRSSKSTDAKPKE